MLVITRDDKMMKNGISRRDWQTLSAYLDGQLSDRERARLETRLIDDSELNIALEEIRSLRSLLQEIPVKRAPRNYTLTPQMVGVRVSQPPSYPALRLASVLSTVLLMLVWFSNLLFPMAMGSLPHMTAISEQPETSYEIVEPPLDPAREAPVNGMDDKESSKVPPGIAGIPDEESEKMEDPVSELEGIVIYEETQTEPAGAKDESDAVDPSGDLEPGETELEHPRLDTESSDLDDDSEVRAEALLENIFSRLSQWGIQDFMMAFLAIFAVTTGLAAIIVRRKVS